MKPARPSFEPGRRYRYAAQVFVSALALAVILLVCNYLAATRKVWRYDLNSGTRVSLSELTRNTLGALTNDLTVTVLFKETSGLFPHVVSLLREYEAASTHVKVRYIDSERDPERAGVLKIQYQLGTRVGDVVVFELGGQRRVVAESELSIFNGEDLRALMSGQTVEVRRSAFQGEWRFTAAIAALLDGAQGRAALIVGHGEHAWDGEDNDEGYAKFARLLDHEKNLAISTLNLTTNDFPPDCQLAVIAGPTSLFLRTEIARLEGFLQRGGRVLLLLNPYAPSNQTGLERWLTHWGVDAPPQFAGDAPDFTVAPLGLSTKFFGTHPLMTPLRKAAGVLYFPFPRVVRPVPARQMPADAPKVDVIAMTSPAGSTKSDLVNFATDMTKGDVRQVEVPLAVAVEKGGVAGVAAARGGARLIVVGDSHMFANNALEQPENTAGNHDFAALCISWLLDRPQALSIGPRPIREWRLTLTDPQEITLTWVLLGALPGTVLLSGLLMWFRRRA